MEYDRYSRNRGYKDHNRSEITRRRRSFSRERSFSPDRSAGSRVRHQNREKSDSRSPPHQHGREHGNYKEHDKESPKRETVSFDFADELFQDLLKATGAASEPEKKLSPDRSRGRRRSAEKTIQDDRYSRESRKKLSPSQDDYYDRRVSRKQASPVQDDYYSRESRKRGSPVQDDYYSRESRKKESSVHDDHHSRKRVSPGQDDYYSRERRESPVHDDHYSRERRKRVSQDTGNEYEGRLKKRRATDSPGRRRYSRSGSNSSSRSSSPDLRRQRKRSRSRSITVSSSSSSRSRSRSNSRELSRSIVSERERLGELDRQYYERKKSSSEQRRPSSPGYSDVSSDNEGPSSAQLTEEQFRDEMYRRLRSVLAATSEPLEREERIARHIHEMAKMSPALFREFMANNAENLASLVLMQSDPPEEDNIRPDRVDSPPSTETELEKVMRKLQSKTNEKKLSSRWDVSSSNQANIGGSKQEQNQSKKHPLDLFGEATASQQKQQSNKSLFPSASASFEEKEKLFEHWRASVFHDYVPRSGLNSGAGPGQMVQVPQSAPKNVQGISVQVGNIIESDNFRSPVERQLVSVPHDKSKDKPEVQASPRIRPSVLMSSRQNSAANQDSGPGRTKQQAPSVSSKQLTPSSSTSTASASKRRHSPPSPPKQSKKPATTKDTSKTTTAATASKPHEKITNKPGNSGTEKEEKGQNSSKKEDTSYVKSSETTNKAQQLLMKHREIAVVQKNLDALKKIESDFVKLKGTSLSDPVIIENHEFQKLAISQLKLLREGKSMAPQKFASSFPFLKVKKKPLGDEKGSCCTRCKVVCSNVWEYLTHLSSEEHEKTIPDNEMPWVNEAMKKYSKERRLPSETGGEFLVASPAFYCFLCGDICVHKYVAVAHLRSPEHQNKYKKFLADCPAYENYITTENLIARTMASAAAESRQQDKACEKPKQQERNDDRKPKNADQDKSIKDEKKKTRDQDKRPKDREKKRRDGDRQSRDGERKSPDRDRRSRDRDRRSRDRERNTRDKSGKSRDSERRSRDRDRKSRDRDKRSNSRERIRRSRDRDVRSRDRDVRSRDRDVRSRDRDVRSRGRDVRSRDRDVRTKDGDRRSKDRDKSSKDGDRRSRDRDKSSKDGDRRSRDRDKSSKDGDRRSRDRDKRSRERDRSSRDRDKTTRDKQDLGSRLSRRVRNGSKSGQKRAQQEDPQAEGLIEKDDDEFFSKEKKTKENKTNLGEGVKQQKKENETVAAKPKVLKADNASEAVLSWRDEISKQMAMMFEVVGNPSQTEKTNTDSKQEEGQSMEEEQNADSMRTDSKTSQSHTVSTPLVPQTRTHQPEVVPKFASTNSEVKEAQASSSTKPNLHWLVRVIRGNKNQRKVKIDYKTFLAKKEFTVSLQTELSSMTSSQLDAIMMPPPDSLPKLPTSVSAPYSIPPASHQEIRSGPPPPSESLEMESMEPLPSGNAETSQPAEAGAGESEVRAKEGAVATGSGSEKSAVLTAKTEQSSEEGTEESAPIADNAEGAAVLPDESFEQEPLGGNSEIMSSPEYECDETSPEYGGEGTSDFEPAEDQDELSKVHVAGACWDSAEPDGLTGESVMTVPFTADKENPDSAYEASENTDPSIEAELPAKEDVKNISEKEPPATDKSLNVVTALSAEPNAEPMEGVQEPAEEQAEAANPSTTDSAEAEPLAYIWQSPNPSEEDSHSMPQETTHSACQETLVPMDTDETLVPEEREAALALDSSETNRQSSELNEASANPETMQTPAEASEASHSLQESFQYNEGEEEQQSLLPGGAEQMEEANYEQDPQYESLKDASDMAEDNPSQTDDSQLEQETSPVPSPIPPQSPVLQDSTASQQVPNVDEEILEEKATPSVDTTEKPKLEEESDNVLAQIDSALGEDSGNASQELKVDLEETPTVSSDLGVDPSPIISSPQAPPAQKCLPTARRGRAKRKGQAAGASRAVVTEREPEEALSAVAEQESAQKPTCRRTTRSRTSQQVAGGGTPEPAMEENPEPAMEENPEPAMEENPEPAMEENPEPAMEENPEPAMEENLEPRVELQPLSPSVVQSVGGGDDSSLIEPEPEDKSNASETPEVTASQSLGEVAASSVVDSSSEPSTPQRKTRLSKVSKTPPKASRGRRGRGRGRGSSRRSGSNTRPKAMDSSTLDQDEEEEESEEGAPASAQE